MVDGRACWRTKWAGARVRATYFTRCCTRRTRRWTGDSGGYAVPLPRRPGLKVAVVAFRPTSVEGAELGFDGFQVAVHFEAGLNGESQVLSPGQGVEEGFPLEAVRVSKVDGLEECVGQGEVARPGDQ